mmetsp:Transcript_88514/g.275226  ORF Transcript_88514/g.275226 Transcript_88514/m.275226 type:complete len:221 (+) Transcript_88514:492-1154(+)
MMKWSAPLSDRDASSAMMEPDVSSPRKPMPQVKLTQKKAAARVAEARVATLGNLQGFAISFSTGSTMPRPSNAKNTLEAKMIGSDQGRMGAARSRKASCPTLQSCADPHHVPTQTATAIARLPSLLSQPSCATKRSSERSAKKGATERVIFLRPMSPVDSVRFPATKLTKQQQTPPCTMKTKKSAAKRPMGPKATCAMSPRSATPVRATARLHSASTSMA